MNFKEILYTDTNKKRFYIDNKRVKEEIYTEKGFNCFCGKKKYNSSYVKTEYRKVIKGYSYN